MLILIKLSCFVIWLLIMAFIIGAGLSRSNRRTRNLQPYIANPSQHSQKMYNGREIV